MNKKSFLFSALSSLLLLACSSERTAENNEQTNRLPMDIHSAYQRSEARAKHLHLVLNADFEAKILQGTARWNIKPHGEDFIYFDTKGLEITRVEDQNGEALTFTIEEEDVVLGSPLRIEGISDVSQLFIHYKTSPDAEALQWLDASQTLDKKAPFLFTQSQAILARTWIPCPDSPGWRFTYSAEISVPKDLMALMSASNPQKKNNEGVYTFEMAQSIPSYLMALAIGDLVFAEVSERSGIYAEPGQLEASVYEFSQMEEMIQAAEKLYGPYEWERYDLLVLPPSFPFGGMENPRLTFATPTIIAGDRSLTALVAHELAHSWSGNLVTNATWNDFWINEGFTVYFEHRIMEEIYGQDYSEMLASLSHADLIEEVEDFMQRKPDDTRLKLDLSGRNPDDGVSRIAYDKGYFFLRLIEETTGRERFDAFLKQYFAAHRFGVMTTEQFLDYLKDELLETEEWDKIGVKNWVYEKGLPDNCPQVQSDRFAKVADAAQNFVQDQKKPETAQTDVWTTHEWLHFIQEINREATEIAQIKQLEDWYAFSESGNSEILAAWWQPVIKHRYTEVYPSMEKFLIEIGRRKFLTPTYRALKETDQLETAREIYGKARPNYHAVSRQTMDGLLASNQ